MLFKLLITALLAGASSLLMPQDAVSAAGAEAADELARAGDYVVDSGHSSALFRVTHLGVGAFWGRFNSVQGELSFDPSDVSKSSVSISIPASSVDSNDEQRDGHLKSPDFFNAKEFPEITFRSTKVEAGEHGALNVTGDFTLLGQTRSIHFEAQHVGHGERGRFGYRSGWEADFSIERSDYGMDFMTGMLGGSVRIIVSLETTLP